MKLLSGDTYSYTLSPPQINAINTQPKAPPQPRGGGPVCGDGGVCTVITVKLERNAPDRLKF